MTRGERDQVRKSLEGYGLAIGHRMRYSVVQRNKLCHQNSNNTVSSPVINGLANRRPGRSDPDDGDLVAHRLVPRSPGATSETEIDGDPGGAVNVWWPDISVRGPVEEQELYWKLIALEELDGTSLALPNPRRGRHDLADTQQPSDLKPTTIRGSTSNSTPTTSQHSSNYCATPDSRFGTVCHNGIPRFSNNLPHVVRNVAAGLVGLVIESSGR